MKRVFILNTDLIALFLDDVREEYKGWSRVTTAKDCISLLKEGIVHTLSLDHDLGEDVGSGYDVVLWMEENVFCSEWEPPKNIIVHSSNCGATRKMIQGLLNIKIKCPHICVLPFVISYPNIPIVVFDSLQEVSKGEMYR